MQPGQGDYVRSVNKWARREKTLLSWQLGCMLVPVAVCLLGVLAVVVFEVSR
jgi:hypothetical protein